MASQPTPFPEFTSSVDCHLGCVMKSITAPYFRDNPEFNSSDWASTSNPLTWEHHFHLRFLNDQWFYLAWLPRTPFPSVDPMAPLTACFSYETKHALPIVPFTRPNAPEGSYILAYDVAKRWMATDILLEKAADALDPLVFNEPVAGVNEREARNAAWRSKKALCGMMAYLSFQLAVCRSRQLDGWNEVLLAATDINFYNWARGSLHVSDTKPNTRLGGFVDPFRPEQKWQYFWRALLLSGIPLCVQYGRKRTTFAEQTANSTLDGRLALTAEEKSLPRWKRAWLQKTPHVQPTWPRALTLPPPDPPRLPRRRQLRLNPLRLPQTHRPRPLPPTVLLQPTLTLSPTQGYLQVPST
ncbi:hypothetical protein EIP91_010607 [Steccherinum ochraceum]|uniref:Uncharacterized protein n=1 Tax=Steccherinum ochraceum TaxID=92696 RepID=A0A4R0R2Z8_9APHY|nr:hypothetical protein EIP91_010607 [Steccherinum ochraceum]